MKTELADEEVPDHLKNDPDLWSGCISGALTEEGFLKAFEDVGFFDFIDPLEPVSSEEALPYDCARTVRRHPKETKGRDYHATTDANSQCCDGGRCC